MAKMLTREQVIKLLKKAQGDRHQSLYARELDVSRAYLSDIYRNRRDPGPTILKRFGLRRVSTVMYEKVK